MNISGKGIDFIKNREGYSSLIYKCPAGKRTIGYGHVIRSGEKFDVIDREEGDRLLRNDLTPVVHTIERYVEKPLNQNQIDALASFVLNIGIYNFRKSTLLKLINQGDFEGAAAQFLRWTKSKGEELAGLKRRRELEAELFKM